MSAYPNTILVSSDQPSLVAELVGKARQLAGPLGWGVAVLPLNNLDLVECGADLLYTPANGSPLDGSPETSTSALAAVIRETQPALVLLGATKHGMEVAPRAAERTGSAYGPWATQISLDSACHTTAQCVLYSGQGTATYQFKTPTTLLTVAAGVFKNPEIAAHPAQVVTIDLPLGAPRVSVIEYHPKSSGSSRIEEARAVVDVGQGVKTREDLALVESVANWLDGQLACTRPVAADRDWFPEWLGLSGKKVSAELCLAVGISGAIQHVIGIRDSRVIVAVNNDENAGIFSQVDYGVVADIYAFLPVFLERMVTRRVHPSWK